MNIVLKDCFRWFSSPPEEGKILRHTTLQVLTTKMTRNEKGQVISVEEIWEDVPFVMEEDLETK